MRILLFIMMLVGAAAGQLPDAPVRQPPAAPVKQSGWHCCYDPHNMRSNREALTNKTFLFTSIADIGVGVFDAEITHQGLAHHRCAEGNVHPPTRANLYKNNLPEEAAVLVVEFMVAKIRAPRWMGWGLLTYPVEVHTRAGLDWTENCW